MRQAQLDDFDRLREYIADHRSRGVGRLPPEPKLSQELNVTRGRLRTLLKRVESEGLIWRHVGKGTFIGQRQSGESNGKLAQSISVEQFFQARLAIEPALAAQAAIHATPSDVAALDACVKEMDELETIDPWKQLNDELHLTIASSSHNPALVLLYETLTAQTAQVSLSINVRIGRIFQTTGDDDLRTVSHREHQAIVNAIRNHDPKDADALMRRHILSVRERLFGHP